MTNKMMHLCNLEEIPDNDSKGFTIKYGDGNLQIFVIRRDKQLYGYINRCPHTGVYLDWTPDQFLDITGKRIQCATHGALFRIEDGLCTYGPCCGDSLTSVSVNIQMDEVFLKLSRGL